MGVNLSVFQLAYLDFLAGFRGDALTRIIAIQSAENPGGVSDTVNNTAYPDKPGYHAPGPNDAPEYSVGPSQINALAHVPDGQTVDQYAQALTNPAFNAAEAFRLSDGGTNFNPWSTFTNGSYQAHMSAAGNAAQTVQGVNTGGSNHPDVPGIPDGDWAKVGGVWLPVPFRAAAGDIGVPANPIHDVNSFFTALGKGTLWWRVGFLLTGGLLVLIGGLLFVRPELPKVVPV